MSLTMLKDKVVQQAEQIALMSNQINFLLRELYKANALHEVFVKNPKLAEQVADAIKEMSALPEAERALRP
jgi:hypothetical protein